MLAQFRAQYTDGLAQFRAQYETDGAELLLIHDVDAGNVSPTLSSITSPLSTSPVIWLDARAAARTGSNGEGWRHMLFSLENAEGKTPVFQLNRATMTNPAASIPADYRLHYTLDFETWVQSGPPTLVGGSTGYIEFAFPSALPAGTVYIATHPMGYQAQADALAAELLTDYSAVASPAESADSAGVFFTSPAETDDLSRAIGGNAMYAIKLAWGGGTTDGARKRKLVMLAGIHAAGEHTSWVSFVAAVRWMLDDASASAVAMRANWDVWLYFNVTPNGIKGGHRRHNFRSSTDPNRNFVTRSLAEVAAVTAAAESDTGGADAMFSWHGHSTQTNSFIPGTKSGDPDTEAFITLGKTIFDSHTNYYNTIAGADFTWGYDVLGAKVSFASEVPQRGDNSLARYQSIGQNWIKTLQLADAAGIFVPAEGGGSASTISVSASGDYVAAESAHGGATSGVSATAAGAGHASSGQAGGDVATVLVAANGTGVAQEQAAGGASAAVTVGTRGAGQAATGTSGGSTAGASADSFGAGTAAESASGASTASLTLVASGGGQPHEQGAASGGGVSLVLVGGAAAGVAAEHALGSGAAGASVASSGAGTGGAIQPYRVTSITGSVPESRIIGAIPSNRIVGAA